MANNFNLIHLSLITLGILIISLLSFLISRTLKEGEKAITEIKKDISQKL